MRIELVILGSLVLSTSVVGNAYYQKKQFYPSVVHITKSNPSMMVKHTNLISLRAPKPIINRVLFSGDVYSSSSHCSATWKVDEKSVFWSIEGS